MSRALVLAWSVTLIVHAAVTARERQTDDVVILDFQASDRSGQPVAGLTPGDVTLKVGGRVRPLLSLEFVGVTDIPRDIVLLVDEPTLFGLEPVARQAITALLASLSPDDRISYITTRRPGQLTRSPGHSAVLADLEAMRTGPGEMWTCVADMLRAIENMARTLPAGRGSFLAVLTRGVLDDTEQIPSRSIGCTPGTDDLRQTRQVIASTQINLHLFAVNHLNRSWGLDTVAANTGGAASLLTWKDAGALARAVSAARTFYRGTFAADPSAPRSAQRVELKINRPGVKVITSPAIDLHPRRP